MTSMTTTPLVTIAIPCYNHEQYVQDSIKSIIDQSYSNIELIIIDDGSKDNSVLKIQELISICTNRFSRFEFRYRENKGLCNTLNEALKWAQGEFFCALASDDLIVKDKIDIQVKYLLQNKECVAVFGGMQYIDNKNNLTGKRVKKFHKFAFKDILLHKHELPAPSQLIRKKYIDLTDGYNPNLKIEDWDMWLKLSKFGTLDYLPQILCLYRLHQFNTINNFELMSSNRLKIIEQHNNNNNYPKSWRNVKLMEHEYYYKMNMLNKSLEVYIEIIKKYPLLFLRFKHLKRFTFLFFTQKLLVSKNEKK